jgi:hypothetical protein
MDVGVLHIPPLLRTPPRHACVGGHLGFCVALFADLLDSRLRGNDESQQPRAKNLRLKVTSSPRDCFALLLRNKTCSVPGSAWDGSDGAAPPQYPCPGRAWARETNKHTGFPPTRV